jgi:hypothetical protein
MPKSTNPQSASEPIVVRLSVEANPSEGTTTIERAEWDAMSPYQRYVMLQDMVDTEIGNAGGAGWYLESGATDAEIDASPPGESLASVHAALRQHMSTLQDQQPWDNRAMLERVLNALDAHFPGQA